MLGVMPSVALLEGCENPQYMSPLPQGLEVLLLGEVEGGHVDDGRGTPERRVTPTGKTS